MPVALTWVREDTPVWDATKEAILGSAPPGALEVPSLRPGALAPGEWFRVDEDGRAVGYGWMDCTWGDAEITLAVDSRRQGEGIGAFIVEHLEREAASRGLNYLYNAVLPTHPDRELVTKWLESLGFTRSGDGLLKRRVRP
jgi:GNAT superfamily N-acetyltransferase